ncbi:MAG: urease accessory protein UreF [Pseudanabaenaceae cyanobacterium bins.39]|nr:urease accessory protein UreF [Pseudanabaenaceae cyanobacterium bins.39]
MTISNDLSLLRLMQLTSPMLPVGAYSYSEGIEYLCDRGIIHDEQTLTNWLSRELQTGFIKTEAAIAMQAYRSANIHDLARLQYWNAWLSATRESEEMRLASWQMGQSLIKLWQSLDQGDQNFMQLLPTTRDNADGQGCNYAIAFGIVAASWAIVPDLIAYGYLYSWLSNLVSAAVRAVPLGQTLGQKVIFQLGDQILQTATSVMGYSDQDMRDQLEWCGWGASLACANHETQYSRLFRS